MFVLQGLVDDMEEVCWASKCAGFFCNSIYSCLRLVTNRYSHCIAFMLLYSDACIRPPLPMGFSASWLQIEHRAISDPKAAQLEERLKEAKFRRVARLDCVRGVRRDVILQYLCRLSLSGGKM